MFLVETYVTKDGKDPVNEFINSLNTKMQAKIIMELDLLAEFGNKLRDPYSSPLGNELFELRIKVGTDISRIIYFFFVGNRIILTNGFIKKQNKTPKDEIKLAKKYREDWLERNKK